MRTLTTTIALALSAGLANATPDVITGELVEVNNYGTSGGVRAYSVATTSCNIGTSNADWISNTNRHPVIGASIFKYDFETGRLTQIGLTQLKHSFASLQFSACTPCQPGGTFQALGPGCSDPYSAGLNGDQRDLGPRTEVNPYTGVFPYPFTGINQTGNTIFKRLQVPQAKIDDSTANFYVEGTYYLQDDAEVGTQFNNASYASFSINQSSYNASTPGPTNRETPAIFAWQAEDPSVQITSVDFPGEGRIYVASKVTDLGGGNYRYDYGVYNLNSDLGVSSFSVPMNSDASGLFFDDIPYHGPMDQNVSGADWNFSDNADDVTWSTDNFSTDPWANAIRWGTMYNFCFETDSPPVQGDVTLGSFKGSETILTGAFVPEATASGCAVDYNLDGIASFPDVSLFLSFFSFQKEEADLNGDGIVSFPDVSEFLAQFSAGCP